LYVKGAAVAEQQHGMQLMQDLASRTGGLEYWVRSRGDIEQAIGGIGDALRSQYNIGYIPANPDRSGRFRRVQVRMARAGLKAHTRTGYRLD
jgi:Ca-activated chloride channel family protein